MAMTDENSGLSGSRKWNEVNETIEMGGRRMWAGRTNTVGRVDENNGLGVDKHWIYVNEISGMKWTKKWP